MVFRIKLSLKLAISSSWIYQSKFMMINCITMNTKARNNDLLLIIKLCQYFVNPSDMICKKSNETLLNKQREREERTGLAILNISKDKERPQELFFPCQNFPRLALIKLKQGRRADKNWYTLSLNIQALIQTESYQVTTWLHFFYSMLLFLFLPSQGLFSF